MTSGPVKDCPFCGESILAQATKCKHCKSDLAAGSTVQGPPEARGSDVLPGGEECPSCKCKVPPNSKRCPHCNADLNPGCLKTGLGCLGILVFLFGLYLAISGWFI